MYIQCIAYKRKNAVSLQPKDKTMAKEKGKLTNKHTDRMEVIYWTVSKEVGKQFALQ